MYPNRIYFGPKVSVQYFEAKAYTIWVHGPLGFMILISGTHQAKKPQLTPSLVFTVQNMELMRPQPHNGKILQRLNAGFHPSLPQSPQLEPQKARPLHLHLRFGVLASPNMSRRKSCTVYKVLTMSHSLLQSALGCQDTGLKSV